MIKLVSDSLFFTSGHIKKSLESSPDNLSIRCFDQILLCHGEEWFVASGLFYARTKFIGFIGYGRFLFIFGRILIDPRIVNCYHLVNNFWTTWIAFFGTFPCSNWQETFLGCQRDQIFLTIERLCNILVSLMELLPKDASIARYVTYGPSYHEYVNEYLYFFFVRISYTAKPQNGNVK